VCEGHQEGWGQLKKQPELPMEKRNILSKSVLM